MEVTPLKAKTPSKNEDRFIPRRNGLNFQMAMDSLIPVGKQNESPGGTPGRLSSLEKGRYRSKLEHGILNGPPGEEQPVRRILQFSSQPLLETSAANRQQCLSPEHEKVGAGHLFPGGEDHQKCGLRRIQRSPVRVLDAPEIGDDFYTQLLDWGPTNLVAVGLGRAAYLWDGAQAHKLTELDETTDDRVASLAWSPDGRYLALGMQLGRVEVWDPEKMEYWVAACHGRRVACLAWADNQLLASGGYDRYIKLIDLRNVLGHVQFKAHKSAPVCGLKWAPSGRHLASGGNDNMALLWDKAMLQTNGSAKVVYSLEHKAAVKALAWAPFQHNLLATGGGTKDTCVRLWNTTTGECSNRISTGSQVTNLIWSPTCEQELVSSHGYTEDRKKNGNLILWHWEKSIQTLSQWCQVEGGAGSRVLHLSAAPDAKTVVAGCTDETLRFWEVFSGRKDKAILKTPIKLKKASMIR